MIRTDEAQRKEQTSRCLTKVKKSADQLLHLVVTPVCEMIIHGKGRLRNPAWVQLEEELIKQSLTGIGSELDVLLTSTFPSMQRVGTTMQSTGQREPLFIEPRIGTNEKVRCNLASCSPEQLCPAWVAHVTAETGKLVKRMKDAKAPGNVQHYFDKVLDADQELRAALAGRLAGRQEHAKKAMAALAEKVLKIREGVDGLSG